MAVTIYIHDGNITIQFPKNEVPDADTIHRIWEAVQAEKKPPPVARPTKDNP